MLLIFDFVVSPKFQFCNLCKFPCQLHVSIVSHVQTYHFLLAILAKDGYFPPYLTLRFLLLETSAKNNWPQAKRHQLDGKYVNAA